ncbi:M12 family metallo-peptidase [uncultured Arcticibacterium sp.]|uniref:M12 family metallo-peptidase n=1 Tax=uncultured Arcticibacterium sp. TaxID=2173042 RepID=UPI0030F8146D
MYAVKVSLLLLLFTLQLPVFGQDSTNVFSCGFDESELDLSFLKNFDTRNFKVKVDGFYSCRIAVDVDYDTYQYFGFNEELIRFELNKMFQKVSLLYEKEINTKLSVSEVHIWKTENDDPYKNEFDIFRMLSILRKNALETKIFEKESDLYMYLPTKNVLGAGGLATGSGNVSPWGKYKTMAHEIGHNFGSPHTQSCSWEGGPLDFCYPAEGTCYENALEDKEGTIMSYCSSTKSTFHPQARDLIRAFAAQNFRFIESVPPSPVLNSEIVNSFNIPYTSFNPVAEAYSYYYEIASDSSFKNIISSDSISFPSIYFDEYANYDQYYFRVKAVNDKGTSPWSNASKVVKELQNLAVPIPEDTFNKKYIDLSASSQDRLNFSPVQNAVGYEIEIIQYTGGIMPVRNYFSNTFKTSVNFSTISQVATYIDSDFMWRVRAYKGNESGAWSEFQYIFNKTESLYSNFNIRRPLPTSFTIIRNNFYQTSTNYLLQKIDNNETIDVPVANIFKEKNRFIFKNLEPNSTYKLTNQVSTRNHLIWGEKAEGLQYTTERTLTTSNENLPTNWQLFSTQDSTTELLAYSKKLSNKYMFLPTNNGLLKYNLNTEEQQIYGIENTEGLIGSQIQMMEIDNDNKLWIFQQVSKRLDFSGVFPEPVYSLMKFNPDNMSLLERFDFEYTDAGELISFDPNRMLFATDSRLLKLNNDRLEFFFDLAELKNTYSQSYTWGFKGDRYWLRTVPKNPDYSELVSINLDDLSTKVYNHETHSNCPQNFSQIFFDELGNPLILNSENNDVLKLQGNEFVTEANLTYQNGYFSNLTYENGIFTARVYSDEPGIYKFYNSEWNKISEYPDYIFGFYDNFTDQTGNVWLNTYNTLVKLSVCSEVSSPKITADSQIDFGGSASIEVSECSSVNWSFNNLSGDVIVDEPTSKTFKPNNNFTYQVSCNDGGCTSNAIEGEVVVVPKLLMNSVTSSTVCPNAEIRYAPSIQGEYPSDNTFSLILTNEVQSFEINANTIEGSYLLDNQVPGGTYWTKIKASSPASFSRDSIQIQIEEAVEVTVSGVEDICNGKFGSLTATGVGNGSFQYFWTDGQSQVLSTSAIFSIQETGNYQLIVLNENQCRFIGDMINSNDINLMETISVEGSKELLPNQTTDLIVSSNPDWVYEWFLNGKTVNLPDANQVTVSSPGIYTVIIKEASCTFETDGIEIKQILANSAETIEWELKIAPNPTEKYIDITVGINTSKAIQFKLISTSGAILKSWESSSAFQRIDVSNLNSGIYYLHTQTNGKTSTKKFIRN